MYFNYFLWLFLLTWPRFHLLYAFFLSRIWISTTSVLSKVKYNVTHLGHPVLEGSDNIFSFLLFCYERHSYNLANQQPGWVFCYPTGKTTYNRGFALVPVTSKRSTAAWGHCCQLYLHGATSRQAELSRLGEPSGAAPQPAPKVKGGCKERGAYMTGLALWEHICLIPERRGCENQKGKLLRSMIWPVSCFQSGVPFSLLGAKTQTWCKRCYFTGKNLKTLVFVQLCSYQFRVKLPYGESRTNRCILNGGRSGEVDIESFPSDFPQLLSSLYKDEGKNESYSHQHEMYVLHS